ALSDSERTTMEDHQECLRDCQMWNRAHPTAVRDCSKACPWPDNTGHGTTSGTSPGTEKCCIGTFAECLAKNFNSPLGLGGCYISSINCANKAPCNTACDSWPAC